MKFLEIQNKIEALFDEAEELLSNDNYEELLEGIKNECNNRLGIEDEEY